MAASIPFQRGSNISFQRARTKIGIQYFDFVFPTQQIEISDTLIGIPYNLQEVRRSWGVLQLIHTVDMSHPVIPSPTSDQRIMENSSNWLGRLPTQRSASVPARAESSDSSGTSTGTVVRASIPRTNGHRPSYGGTIHPAVHPGERLSSGPSIPQYSQQPQGSHTRNQRSALHTNGYAAAQHLMRQRPHSQQQQPPVHILNTNGSAPPSGARQTFSNGQRGGSSYRSSQAIALKAQWRDWARLGLRLHPVPLHTTTFDLWQHFKPYGQIIFIDLEDDVHAARTGVAYVHFSPPPTKECWGTSSQINIQGQSVKVKISLLPQRIEQVQSPGGQLYDSKLSLTPKSLRFGILVSENTMMDMRTLENSLKGDFSLTVDLRYRSLEIQFACDIKDPRREDPSIKGSQPNIKDSPIGAMECTSEYKAQISFTHLTKLIQIKDDDEDTWSLVISLSSPPVFYKKQEYGRSHSKNISSWGEKDAWNRTVDVSYDTSWFKEEAISLPRTHQYIDIGRWTTYKLTFTKADLAAWDTMKHVLQDFNIDTDSATTSAFSTIPAQVSNIWEILEPQVSIDTANANLALLAGTEDVHLPYDVRYQLEVCLSQGILNEVNIEADFLRGLADLSSSRSARRDRARDLLTYVAESHTQELADGPRKVADKRVYDPMSLFQNRKAMSHYPEIGLPEHCVWIRKVVVTPSTVYLSTPTPEPSNRILRHYSSFADRFLRVQFTDELVKGRIFPEPESEQNNALFNRIFRALRNGLQIGGRHFQFLAFGNSQFRENGAYFFSPTDHITCDNIRSWMGEVNHIKVVAKHAARLGQCFSTTRIPKGIPIGQTVKEIADIERNGWCFSDGVGKISPDLAKYIAKHLKLTKKNVPSAFQFRLGGCKGLLVCWPDLSFNEIHIRPSQKKFKASAQNIEIIKSSRYAVATLNRQTITILSTLGVPDAVFVKMLQTQLAGYNGALEDPTIAMKLLSRYVDQNGITTNIAQMIVDGLMQEKEPFFMSILQVWRAWSLRLLREKARIVVDKGAFVFGCLDETFTLRGHHKPTGSVDKDLELPQIFLQIPNPNAPIGEDDKYIVVTGLCVVGRNPSLHPGDLRVVEAVDVPQLRHLRDVVVFPATGDRDIPSMCSGGDLDGDDFFVIWDPELIPPSSEWNYAPMHHDSANTPKELPRDVRPSDLIQFFVAYMKNDSLSSIAMAHLALSDRLGPKDPMCVELAQLHSKAVDYPKSGQPAHLKRSLRPKKWPHFMEKPNRYVSTKILGQLYDLVAAVDFKPNYNGAFDERILRRYRLDEEVLRNARIIKKQHDKALRQIMNQREIATEFEVWSTFVLTKPRVGNDYNMQETMGGIVSRHRERFKTACVKVAGSREPSILCPLIAATYRITWEEVQVALQTSPELFTILDRDTARRKEVMESMPLISFPWIFEHELGRIANMRGDPELDRIPQVTPSLFDEDKGEDEDKDKDEYERLVAAGLMVGDLEDGSEGDGELNGDGASSSTESRDQQALSPATATAAATKTEEDMVGEVVEEDIVEMEDEDNGMDALEKLVL
ncbi:Uu.00g119290.m01.CDS01 [Anthostomella pinea]|uniref:Uu.00g119290.m01.CDS01 n=1 Tax=Anthostomella pinea TaxID=933095 RepID=A0AAI8VGL3_9PEZI|nr:Uu.00g119290.m01.CDS01 [Anthostomella pinea]